MSQEDPATKTEEPTEKKLREARRKGDTPASREPAAVAGLLALAALAGPLAAGVTGRLGAGFADAIDGLGAVTVGAGATGLADLGDAVAPVLRAVGVALGPTAGLLVAAALVGAAAQGGFVVAPSRLVPKWSKISPFGGAKRLVSPDALMEFAKNLLKVVAVCAIAAVVTVPLVAALWARVGLDPLAVLDRTGAAAARMIGGVAVLSLAIAAADVAWKRRRWRRKQRMSQKEIRDEHKDSEGDPILRARRDGVRRGRARQRMAAAVPGATLVITNPTHYAVALRYEAGRDAAPVCVAKGLDRQAARIRALARGAEVPIVENRPLARALHATVEIDDAIPAQHWQAVAEIIGYLSDLRIGRRRAAPRGSRMRIED